MGKSYHLIKMAESAKLFIEDPDHDQFRTMLGLTLLNLASRYLSKPTVIPIHFEVALLKFRGELTDEPMSQVVIYGAFKEEPLM